jgi:hypothetical protein
VTPPVVDDFPPITVDPIIPPIVLKPRPPVVPPVGPPEVIDPPVTIDPPCRVLTLPPRAAVERITKCQGTPAELTRR